MQPDTASWHAADNSLVQIHFMQLATLIVAFRIKILGTNENMRLSLAGIWPYSEKKGEDPAVPWYARVAPERYDLGAFGGPG